MRCLLLIGLLVCSCTATAEDSVDYVNLGATLLKDGYTDRAKIALNKANVTKPGFDFARYYSLKGILLHRQGYPDLSNRFFDASIDKGQGNQSTHLYIARNHWQLGNHTEVIAALDRAGEMAKNDEQMFVIKAESHKQLGAIRQAWNALDEGIERFPDHALFYRQKFYYLLELGYFQLAGDYAKRYIERQEYSAKDYLAVAYALRENRQLEQAAVLLEEAMLRHPENPKLIELLGQVYIDQEQYLVAALVYDRASIRFLDLAAKSATLYLKSDQPIRSLQLNRRILDQKEKFKQRLGIDIYLQDFEAMVAKVPALARYGLLDDDSVNYAVGYAYFQNGDFDAAKKFLSRVVDAELFESVSQIFSQIEQCQHDTQQCI